MKSVASFFALLFLVSFSALAQKGSITGVVNTLDGKPAEFVSVRLKGTALGAVVNEKGIFEIKKINPGKYTLITSYVGSKAKEMLVEIRANETTNVPTIIISENAEKLNEVIVVATKNKYLGKNVSSSLKLTSPIIELPQNIQIVSTDLLKDQQIISMSDGLVRNVSGLVRFEHWGDMYTNIQARGSQLQAFRNGFNVVNSSWGPLTEDMSFVDHIEFVKGPAGFMLSSGDPAGLYNVVTKKPTGQTKAEIGITFGSFGLYRANLDLDGKLSKDGKLLYRLNLSAQKKASFRPNEYNDRYTFAPVISYQIDKNSKLSFEYNYQRANMSNVGSFYVFSPTGYGTYPIESTMLPTGMPNTAMDDHSFYINYQHNFNKNWKLTTQASYFLYKQAGQSMWSGVVNPNGTFIRNVGLWDAKSDITLGQAFLNGEVMTGTIRHKILTGLDMGNKSYLADWGQSHNLDLPNAPFDPKNPYLGVPAAGYPVFDRTKPLAERATKVGGLIDLKYTSLYLQDELSFFNNALRLTLAGRYTDLQQSAYGGSPDKAKHFTPRIGLSGSITKSFTVYALYDQSFSPQSGRLTNGGKVQPITGNNVEFGLKKSWFENRWNTSLSVYKILKNNELTPDPNSPPTSGLSVELGQKQTKGIELDLIGNIAKGLDLITNYSYTDSKVSKVTEGVTAYKVGQNLPGYSKHSTNAWLTYKINGGTLKGVGFNAGYTLLINRTSLGDGYWGGMNTKKMDNYFKVDGGVFYEINKLKIVLSVFNVLNKYLYNGSYYQYSSTYYYQTEAPRNFRMSINYRF